MPAIMTSRQRSSGTCETRPLPARKDKHIQNRAAILRAAARLFFSRGYAGVSVDELAREVGMTKPYLYYYFKAGKAEIFGTLCLDAAEATLSSFDFAWTERTPVLEVLHEGFRRLAMANMEHFEASCLYNREPHVVQPDVRKRITDAARDFTRTIRNLIERGHAQGVLDPRIDPAVAALSISGVIGFMYRWYDPSGRFQRERMADELAAAMLRVAGVMSVPCAAPAVQKAPP